MNPMETTRYGDEGEVRVRLHGEQNVILQLREVGPTDDDATPWIDSQTWGFRTVSEWRSFLKALVRFDDTLGTRP